MNSRPSSSPTPGPTLSPTPRPTPRPRARPRARLTSHLSAGHVRAGLVLEADPGGDGAALQARHGRAARPAAEVVIEKLRSLYGTAD